MTIDSKLTQGGMQIFQWHCETVIELAEGNDCVDKSRELLFAMDF